MFNRSDIFPGYGPKVFSGAIDELIDRIAFFTNALSKKSCTRAKHRFGIFNKIKITSFHLTIAFSGFVFTFSAETSCMGTSCQVTIFLLTCTEINSFTYKRLNLAEAFTIKLASILFFAASSPLNLTYPGY